MVGGRVECVVGWRDFDRVTTAAAAENALEERGGADEFDLSGSVDGEVDLVVDEIQCIVGRGGEETEDARVGAGAQGDDLFLGVRRMGIQKAGDEAVDGSGADVGTYDG